MSWIPREVRRDSCQHCFRESPGSGYYRCVNEPTKPHPRRAFAFHCYRCDRHIGKARIHYLVGADVLCFKCWFDLDRPDVHLSSRTAAARFGYAARIGAPRDYKAKPDLPPIEALSNLKKIRDALR